MPRRRQQGTGGLYERGKQGGRKAGWVAVADLGWLPGGGRDRREFTGATAVEADGKRAAFMAARADGFTAPRGRPYYVGEWVLRWLENTARPRISEATYSRTYLHHVRDLIAPYFERVPLPELTVEDIEAWHAQLARRPARRGGGMVSAATIGQAHTILSMALNTAVARRKLPHNPCALVHPPRSRPARPEPPTADEVVRIIERCQTWPYGARWIVAITTGIRQGEALRLRWRHVHLDGNEPYIDVPGTKSEAAVRAAPLPPVAVDALREWRRTQVRDLTDGRVFTLPQRADWQNWRDLTGDLGLPHYRVHDLRHAFATALLEEGEDIKVVQVLIGHASPDFTRRVYQHVRPVLHRRAADAMQRYVTGQ